MSEKYIYDEKTGTYIPIDENEQRRKDDDKLFGILIWGAQFVIPLIASIIAYIYYENKNNYLRNIAKEALNFNISSILYALIATFSSFLIGGLGAVVLGFSFLPFLSFLFIPVVSIYSVVIPIIGMLKASEMKVYEPHFTIRFLK